MKQLILRITVLLFYLLLLFLLTMIKSSAYFSKETTFNTSITTGSVDVIADDIKIINENTIHNKNSKTIIDNTINGGILFPNTLVDINFNVKNIGSSITKYNLAFGIFFDGITKEKNKVYLYPSFMNKEEIFNDINNNNTKNAIIGSNVLDDITNPYNYNEEGILENIDTSVLDCYHLSSKEYSFRLVLNEDIEIKNNPSFFEGRKLKIKLILTSCLPTSNSWTNSSYRSIDFMTKTDFLVPVIEEIENPKNFFIKDASSINLKDYVYAYDLLDGNITNDIIISSTPSFNPLKEGEYKIRYDVKNSKNTYAIPLEITINIWNFIKIASGNYHTLALTSNKLVYSFGYNNYGQLGDGTQSYSQVPKLVEGLENVVDIAASFGSSYALCEDGLIYAWGRNTNGRLGDGTTRSRNRPTLVKTPSGVVFEKISARFNNAGAISKEGDVYTWGYSGYGSCGNYDSVENHVPTKIDLKDIVSLEMGYYNGAAIDKFGRLYTWGDNLHGQLGVGKPTQVGANPISVVSYFLDKNIKIKDVSVGWYHAGAVSDDGRLFTFGYGVEGRLGNNLSTDQNIPYEVILQEEASFIVCGYYHSAILTKNKTVYFFGQNAYGKQGDGTVSNNWTPTLLKDIYDVRFISLGLDSSFVLTDYGDVYGMGYGGTGVLGTNNNQNSTKPVVWAFTPPLPY